MQVAYAKRQEKTNKKTIHSVLAGSYMVYLVAVLVGFILDIFFHINFVNQGLQIIGFVFMIFAPLLISESQKASRRFKQTHLNREINVTDFMHGPYRYLQSPTHMGLFVLSIGFALVFSSAPLLFMVFVAYVVTHTIFLPNEQKLLKKKYGAPYEAYLKKVHLSI